MKDVTYNGEWACSVDPQVPGCVHLEFVRVGPDGTTRTDLWMYPDDAQALAASLDQLANQIRTAP